MHGGPVISSMNMLRTFTIAARALSFKAAAQQLGLSPTAVSHQIRKLEDELGTDLFYRETRRVTLTKAGRTLLSATGRWFDGVEDAVRSIRQEAQRESVTITTTMALAAFQLAPLAAKFRDRFPDIDLRVLSGDAVIDLAQGGADLALRYSEAPSRKARIIAECPFAPVGTGEAAERWQTRDAPGTGLTFRWYNPATAPAEWETWHRQFGEGGSLIEFSDEAHAILAAIKGQGVLYANLPIIARELHEGALTILERPAETTSTRYLVLERAPGHSAGAGDDVFEWLAEEIERGTDWQYGQMDGDSSGGRSK